MPEFLSDPNFWIGLGEIVLVNIVLSGDNAVVIALAARSLPPDQRQRAVVWGSVAAILMRIVLTVVAVKMLQLPYLKLIGSGLLFWLALQLLAPETESTDGIDTHDKLLPAIRTILLADLVMSLDNVIAVAAAAKGSMVLLIAGLAISIPLVIFGSTLLLRLMERFPIIIVLGAALLGFVSGEMLVSEPILESRFAGEDFHWLTWAIPVAGAALVVIGGKWLAGRKAVPPALVDLAADEERSGLGH